MREGGRAGVAGARGVDGRGGVSSGGPCLRSRLVLVSG